MNCYITNPKQMCEYPKELNKDNTLFYPESGMTTIEKHSTGVPEHYHIVTDEPMFVALYDKRNVFYWEDGEWKNPKIQTFGTSLSIILLEFFNITYSIPLAVVNGNITNVMGHPLKNKKK